MAPTRLAKPRGGRRPATANSQIRQTQQFQQALETQPSFFNADSQTQQHLSNGNPPNQISQSFPPFGASSNTGFNFSTSQNMPNNPFANAPPPNTEGFKGNIFNTQEKTNLGIVFPVNTEYDRPGKSKSIVQYARKDDNDVPLFAEHAPWRNNTEGTVSSDQSQNAQNPFTIATSQQEGPSAAAPNPFSQSTAQPQETPSAAAIDPFLQNTPGAAAPNPFLQNSVQQQQTPNVAAPNPFLQNTPGAAYSNPFANNNVHQQQAPIAAAPNLFLQNIAQPQQTPSAAAPNPFMQNAAQQQQQQPTPSNIFAPAQPAKTTADLFAHIKQPEAQSSNNPFAQSVLNFQPPNPAQDPNNIFGNLARSQPSAATGQNATFTADKDHSMMSTTPDTSPLGSSNVGSTQPEESPTKNAMSAGTGRSLFDRISKPANGISMETPVNQAVNSGTSTKTKSIFDNISKPGGEASSQSQSLQNSSSPFKFPQPSQPLQPSNIFQPQSGETQAPKKKLFGGNLPAQPSAPSEQSLFIPAESPLKPPVIKQPVF